MITYIYSTFTLKFTQMEVATFTAFRQNMKSYFEKVLNMGVPLFITRAKGRDLVLLSKSEYDSMQETFHLLKSPKNADRLLKAIEQDKSGGGSERELLD